MTLGATYLHLLRAAIDDDIVIARADTTVSELLSLYEFVCSESCSGVKYRQSFDLRALQNTGTLTKG